MKRLLTDNEKQRVTILKTDVTFLPASYDKRFCSGLPLDIEYTEKQINYINHLFHKYRRQIKNYGLLLTQAEEN